MSKRPPNTLDKITPSSPEKKHATQINSDLISASYVTIQRSAGSCWTGLLICQKCQIKPTHYLLLNDWLMELYCGTCNSKWKVCTICPFNKKQFFNINDVKRHQQQNSHQKNPKKRRYHTWM